MGGVPKATAQPAERMALQQVIARGNQAQARAIETRDPSGMRETSTDAFYQELVRINEELLAAGIRTVRLDQIEWGPIIVEGNTATVVCFETWTTTYTDGRVEQSRDLNVYTLVRQGDAWKIEADEHPVM